MRKELFNDLVASIREAGKIHRGEMRASREFAFDPKDVRAIREKLHQSGENAASRMTGHRK
jgi:putative transcriptional regulator